MWADRLGFADEVVDEALQDTDSRNGTFDTPGTYSRLENIAGFRCCFVI